MFSTFASIQNNFPGLPLLLALLLLVYTPFLAVTGSRLHKAGASLAAVIALLGLVPLALALGNLAVPDYVDNVEPTVVANGWIWWHGGEMYPAVQPGGDLRGLLYGPLTFQVMALAPVLFGASVLVSKVPPVLALFGTVVLTFLACRKGGSPVRAAVVATACLTITLGITDAPFWVRSDSLLILLAAAATLLSARPSGRPLVSAILVGLMAGAASACKVHGAAYMIPAGLALLSDVPGWKKVTTVLLPAGLAAVVAFVLPFLPAGISVSGFLQYLERASHHGLALPVFLGNAGLVLGTAIPVFILSRTSSLPRGGRWMLIGIGAVLGASAVAVIAAKPGAGYPHLLPFLPYAALLLSQVLPPQPSSRAAAQRIVLALLFLIAFALPTTVRAGLFASRRTVFATIADGNRQIHDIARTYAGQTIAVGYGGPGFLDMRLAYLRAVPAFLGNPYPYDATAMDDLFKGGVDPARALDNLGNCKIAVWLIPGDEMFMINNYYGGKSFSDDFRALFRAKYHTVPSDGPFHVWVCNKS